MCYHCQFSPLFSFISEGESGEYVVEAVLGDRVRGGKKQYKLRWQGFTEEDDTWEDIGNCVCCSTVRSRTEQAKWSHSKTIFFLENVGPFSFTSA